MAKFRQISKRQSFFDSSRYRFLIWKTKFFVKDSVLKKYPLGILRRFLISYDSETETYSPYFYIICVCPNDLKTETFKTNVLLKWYATWIKTFGYYEDAKIKYSLINELKSEEEIEAELEKFGSLADYDFCDADSLFNIQDWLAQRNLFSATGIFREELKLKGNKQRHFYDPYREPAKKPTLKNP